MSIPDLLLSGAGPGGDLALCTAPVQGLGFRLLPGGAFLHDEFLGVFRQGSAASGYRRDHHALLVAALLKRLDSRFAAGAAVGRPADAIARAVVSDRAVERIARMLLCRLGHREIAGGEKQKQCCGNEPHIVAPMVHGANSSSP